MTVDEAQDGQQILAGHAYIAPGDQHLLVVRDGARYVCRLDDGEPVNRHKPSVDVLFHSVAQNAGRNAIGVLLTGMGRDGARGLKDMRKLRQPHRGPGRGHERRVGHARRGGRPAAPWTTSCRSRTSRAHIRRSQKGWTSQNAHSAG